MINKWHNYLRMPKESEEWYRSDINDELIEYYNETKFVKSWSELSDVVYSYTRAKNDGFTLEFPFSKIKYYLGAIYMFPKYTSRWLFFRRACKKAGAKRTAYEVRNPRRATKLKDVARKYDIDSSDFEEICKKQLRHWPLLP